MHAEFARGLAGVLSTILLMTSVGISQQQGLGSLQQGLPEGEVKMTTDKLCYNLGEQVSITATGWAKVPSIGDFPDIFWVIAGRAGTVFESFNPADEVYEFDGVLRGTWNQTYRYINNTPPSGEQVPTGQYQIWFYMLPPPVKNWTFWPPASIVIGNCNANMRVLTNKDCYEPGETVNITYFNAGSSMLRYSNTPPLFSVYDSSGAYVAMPRPMYLSKSIYVPPNGSYSGIIWDQIHYLYDADLEWMWPGFTFVPEGAYTVFGVADTPPDVAGMKRIVIDIDCNSASPTAEAGPDQTINEGDVVHFAGTGGGGGVRGGKWTPRKAIPSPRMGGGSTVLDGEIYYAGGGSSFLSPYFYVPAPSKTFQKYNPATDTWHDLPDMPEPRSFLGLEAVNGKIYAFGGNDSIRTRDTTFVFDPLTNDWSELGGMPEPLESFGIAAVGDYIYIAGGRCSWPYPAFCPRHYRFDPRTSSYARMMNVPISNVNVGSTTLDGKFYVHGGWPEHTYHNFQAYDATTDSWSLLYHWPWPHWPYWPYPDYKGGHALEALNGEIYSFGGILYRPYDETLVYNLTAGNWTARVPMLSPRALFGSGVVGNCIYAFGGFSEWAEDFPHISEIHFPEVSEAYCLGGDLDYAWDFDATVDSDGDGNFTNDAEFTGTTPTWTYGDDGVYVVTLTVTDRIGHVGIDTTTVTVLNSAPTVVADCTPGVGGDADVYLRIAGEKWHDVHAVLYEDGVETGNVSIVRMPGSPNDQMARLGVVSSGGGKYSVNVMYTPENDPINGQLEGATPAWIILRQDNGSDIRLHHTFNVRHPETWNWTVTNLEGYIDQMSLTCTATATDPGSDDLTFIWDWGDGTPATATTYYNDGVGPDPYPSPGGPFPFTVTDSQTHAYITAGIHVVKLTVLDDDGGSAIIALSPLVHPAKSLLALYDVGSLHLLIQKEAHTQAIHIPQIRDRPPFDPLPPSGS